MLLFYLSAGKIYIIDVSFLKLAEFNLQMQQNSD